MTVKDILISIIRTAVPALVGLLISAAAKANIHLDSVIWSILFDLVVINAYYALCRFLESKWPWVGILLGWAVQPRYVEKT